MNCLVNNILRVLRIIPALAGQYSAHTLGKKIPQSINSIGGENDIHLNRSRSAQRCRHIIVVRYKRSNHFFALLPTVFQPKIRERLFDDGQGPGRISFNPVWKFLSLLTRQKLSSTNHCPSPPSFALPPELTILALAKH